MRSRSPGLICLIEQKGRDMVRSFVVAVRRWMPIWFLLFSAVAVRALFLMFVHLCESMNDAVRQSVEVLTSKGIGQ